MSGIAVGHRGSQEFTMPVMDIERVEKTSR